MPSKHGGFPSRFAVVATCRKACGNTNITSAQGMSFVMVNASAQDDLARLPQYQYKPRIARVDAVTTSVAIHDHTAIVDYRRVYGEYRQMPVKTL